MPRQFIALLLSVLLVIQPATKTFIVFGFIIQRKFIISTLCEQRNKVVNCCLGKCHLKKELTKQDRKENGQGARHQPQTEQLLYTCEDVGDLGSYTLVIFKRLRFMVNRGDLYPGMQCEIYQPPDQVLA
ncbi:MAG: hypothetical protein U0V49_14045 [Saprospiraceae bacterium]